MPLPGKCLLRNYYVPDVVTSHYISTPFKLCMHIDAAIQAYSFTETQVVDGQVMMLYIRSCMESIMLTCTKIIYKQKWEYVQFIPFSVILGHCGWC